jgi:hypothetical protein
LLNPIYYIKEKEKTLYYNDADGHVYLELNIKQNRTSNFLPSSIPVPFLCGHTGFER